MKGIQSYRPLHTNRVQSSFDKTNQRAGEPKDEQLRISYGVIAAVDEETSRVRVNILNKNGIGKRIGALDDGNKEGIWIPVLQPLQIIHHLYGALRKGLVVRVYWRGKNAPSGESVCEVLGELDVEIFLSGSKETRSNELATAPHDIFTGGLGL